MLNIEARLKFNMSPFPWLAYRDWLRGEALRRVATGKRHASQSVPLERMAGALTSRPDAYPELRMNLDPQRLARLAPLLAERNVPRQSGSSGVVEWLSRWRGVS